LFKEDSEKRAWKLFIYWTDGSLNKPKEGGINLGQQIVKSAQAGLDKKQDALVSIEPAELGSGINMEVKSSVFSEFGSQIEATVRAVLVEFGIEDVVVKVQDQGAMDFAIRARTETAVRRAMNK
jgi:citrate lyase subunit gamma (acyl carrier protein)